MDDKLGTKAQRSIQTMQEAANKKQAEEELKPPQGVLTQAQELERKG